VVFLLIPVPVGDDIILSTHRDSRVCTNLR
jgi:hypothetical protein